MTLEKLRDRVIGLVLEENKQIPREFVKANWDYLKTYVDESLNKSNKFILKKKVSYAFLILELIVSSCLGYFLIELFNYSLWKTLALCSVLILNLEMIYYRDFIKLFHRLFIFFKFRVKNYSSFMDVGYFLVYIGLKGNKLVVLPLNKIKKCPKLTNPVMYVVTKDCLYSVMFDYVTNKNSLGMDFIKYDVFLSVNQSYINLRVLNELEELRNH